jgi:hypothetical protein
MREDLVRRSADPLAIIAGNGSVGATSLAVTAAVCRVGDSVVQDQVSEGTVTAPVVHVVAPLVAIIAADGAVIAARNHVTAALVEVIATPFRHIAAL